MKAIKFDYFRPGRPVSPRRSGFSRPAFTACVAFILTAALPAAAQYAGKVPESKKNGPDLRAVGVLEWTGEPGHPKASRLVPICLWDGQDLQDASIYMAQPEPLALQSEVEYKLKKDGKTIGYYVINGAAQTQGTWVGVGAWKPLTQPKPAAPPEKVTASIDDSDRPILHRKNKTGDSSGNAQANEPPPDPDRPVLREPPKETKKPDAAQSPTDQAYSQPIANLPDPDRPHLFRGKPENAGAPVLPTLAGLPPNMNQTVAVSDATSHPDHLWNYSWPNPQDETKLRSDLEDIARKALAPAPTPAPAKSPARRSSRSSRRAKPAPPPPPMALQDEEFHAFQLTYGGPATLIFSAHTAPAAPAAESGAAPGGTSKSKTSEAEKGNSRGNDHGMGESVQIPGSAAKEKFITLIAQPDLYGNVIVLYKNITDDADLDENPVMHLINPVDAMADNRGELLFELRGATQREFALYRVLDGKVQKLFTSSPEAVVIPPIAPPASSSNPQQ
jgi:hypothetical protein